MSILWWNNFKIAVNLWVRKKHIAHLGLYGILFGIYKVQSSTLYILTDPRENV